MFADPGSGLIGKNLRDDHSPALHKLRQQLLRIAVKEEELGILHETFKIHQLKLVGNCAIMKIYSAVGEDIGLL